MMSSTCTGSVCADQIGGQAGPGGGLHLFGIADHGIDLGHRGEGLGLGLGGAAGDDQLGVRVVAAQLADFLPGLAHRLGRHGAGVDDHRVFHARLRRPALSSPRSHRRSGGSRGWRRWARSSCASRNSRAERRQRHAPSGRSSRRHRRASRSAACRRPARSCTLRPVSPRRPPPPPSRRTTSRRPA